MSDVIIPADDGGWTLAEAVTGHVNRLLLYGPPGTGKSFHAQKGARSFYRIYLTEDTPMFELRGGPTLPEGKWQDGPCIRAWREGKRLVLDEIDKAPSEAMSFLLGVLDDFETAALTLPHGETVTPRNGFHVVATTNGEPGDLPDALRDRFTVCVQIDKPHPEAIKTLPQDLRQAAEASARAEEHRRVSIRGWSCFADLRGKIGHDAAAQAVFGKRHQDILDAFSIAELVKGKNRPPKASANGRRVSCGLCKSHSACGEEGYAAIAQPSPMMKTSPSGTVYCDAHMSTVMGKGHTPKITNAGGRYISYKEWLPEGKYYVESPY